MTDEGQLYQGFADDEAPDLAELLDRLDLRALDFERLGDEPPPARLVKRPKRPVHRHKIRRWHDRGGAK